MSAESRLPLASVRAAADCTPTDGPECDSTFVCGINGTGVAQMRLPLPIGAR